MITPAQSRMARAALGISRGAVSVLVPGMPRANFAEWEAGNSDDALEKHWIEKIEQAYIKEGVFFGPRNGVCLEQDIWKQDRRLKIGLLKLLAEYGYQPGAGEIS